jgi:hypothetical protein
MGAPNIALMAATAYLNDYDLAFQISPIMLSGGIVSNAQGGLVPLTTYMGNLTPGARFIPAPGGTLVSQAIGMYPFANQFVAANATIRQPLTLSMVMICPVNQPGGYLSKLPDFTALQTTLQSHNALGGMYAIATPAFVYNNLLMTAMTDVTTEEDVQKQIQWQLDFIQPIVTGQQAAAALNSLMQKVSGGNQLPATPTWSGNTNASPASLTGVTAALEVFGGSFGSQSGTNSISGNPSLAPGGVGIG